MRPLYILLIVLTILGCLNDENNSNAIDQNNLKERKIDSVLKYILITKHPNYAGNTLVREKATKDLEAAIDTLYKKKRLEEIPLKVFKVGKNTMGPGAIVQFYADNEKDDDRVLSNKLGFDVIGFADEELAAKLTEGNDKEYYIYGHKYTKATQEMVDLLVDMTFYSVETEVKATSYSTKINIGVFICEIDSIK